VNLRDGVRPFNGASFCPRIVHFFESLNAAHVLADALAGFAASLVGQFCSSLGIWWCYSWSRAISLRCSGYLLLAGLERQVPGSTRLNVNGPMVPAATRPPTAGSTFMVSFTTLRTKSIAGNASSVARLVSMYV